MHDIIAASIELNTLELGTKVCRHEHVGASREGIEEVIHKHDRGLIGHARMVDRIARSVHVGVCHCEPNFGSTASCMGTGHMGNNRAQISIEREIPNFA